MVAPKNEHICVIYTGTGGKKYACTTNQFEEMYWLYEIVNDKLVKTKYKSKCPLDFDEVIFSKDKLNSKNKKEE